MGLNVAGVDLVRSARGPVVLEVNSTPGFEGIERATGKDISGMIITNLEKLQPGKAFCRVNKGYFETAFRKLLGNKVKKIEINFLKDEPEKNMCVEELIFYHNSDKV